MSTNSDLQQACFDVTDVVAQGKQIEGPTDQNGCLNGQVRSVTHLPLILIIFPAHRHGHTLSIPALLYSRGK